MAASDRPSESSKPLPAASDAALPGNAGEANGDEAAEMRSLLPKIIRFESLTRCGDEVWIENGGQIYRLRRTRQGKLILTK